MCYRPPLSQCDTHTHKSACHLEPSLDVFRHAPQQTVCYRPPLSQCDTHMHKSAGLPATLSLCDSYAYWPLPLPPDPEWRRSFSFYSLRECAIKNFQDPHIISCAGGGARPGVAPPDALCASSWGLQTRAYRPHSKYPIHLPKIPERYPRNTSTQRARCAHAPAHHTTHSMRTVIVGRTVQSSVVHARYAHHMHYLHTRRWSVLPHAPGTRCVALPGSTRVPELPLTASPRRRRCGPPASVHPLAIHLALAQYG